MTHTVYFDTSFYVELERTRSQGKIDFALGIISGLRDRGIRRVESMELVLELSKGTDVDGKKYLVDLLHQWDPTPLRIGDVSIAYICSFDEMLRPLRRFLDMKSDIAAMCAHARTPDTASANSLTHENALQLVREAASLLAMFDVVILNEFDPQNPDLRQLAEAASSEVKMLMAADLKTLHEWLENHIRTIEATSPGSLRQHMIQKTILAGDLRSSKVAQGVASEAIKRNHHSTILDLDHLSVFQRNNNLIDWMMMDRRAIAALDALVKPQLLPFRHRIFSARLDNVIPIMDALGRNDTR